MKCDQCEGFGMLADTPGRPPWPVSQARQFRDCGRALGTSPMPCPRCGGTGISHCCEGDQCHPGEPE